MEEKSQSKRSSGGEPPRHTAAGVEGRSRKSEPLPVWFFVGIIFVIYGLIILITGLTEISHPPHTILSGVHPAIWWGAVIAALGGFFMYRFGPWNVRR